MCRIHVPGVIVVASTVPITPVSPPKRAATPTCDLAPEEVDAAQAGAGADAVLVRDAHDDDGQQSQRFCDGHIEHHRVALEPRLDEDGGEQPELIEPALIERQRGPAKRLSHSRGQVPLDRDRATGCAARSRGFL